MVMSKPLNVNGVASKESALDGAGSKAPGGDAASSTASIATARPEDITSPHELTAYVRSSNDFHKMFYHCY